MYAYMHIAYVLQTSVFYVFTSSNNNIHGLCIKNVVEATVGVQGALLIYIYIHGS